MFAKPEFNTQDGALWKEKTNTHKLFYDRYTMGCASHSQLIN